MSKNKKPIDDVELDQILKNASLLAKNAFPTTPEAVAETENQAIPPLPKRLQNPEVAFNRALLSSNPAPIIQRVSEEVQGDFLAMAARKGGEVSEDTRKLMDADRDLAENNLNDENDG